jgi:ornithine decarboxylase
MNPHFTLSKSKLASQLKTLTDLNLKVIYSYKTNHEIGDILQQTSPQTDFSIHAHEEIPMIKDKTKIHFFTQAESVKELEKIISQGIKNFVVDNEIDLQNLLKAAKSKNEKSKTFQQARSNKRDSPQAAKRQANTNNKINISIRMKFHEHRIGTGKYFVYGLPSSKVNHLIQELQNNPQIDQLGIHIHRKSQNTSEWEIVEELQDSIEEKTYEIISTLNLGGGLPVEYKSYTASTLPYILNKIQNAKKFLDSKNVQTIIEPGRFLAAPPVKLHTSIIQIQNNILILNTTIYQCALDTILTETKMLVEQETQEGKDYLLKGNSPTRDDIFRYKVKLPQPKIGDQITFLNAGAYNYTTDFFGYKKLRTKIIE